MISQRAKYALRALVGLAQAEGGSLIVGRLADEQSIPRRFLEQILLELKSAGLVASRRGKFGGYALAVSPDRITFGQVLRLVDGPIAPLPCLSRIAYRRCADCKDEGSCEIRRVFARVASATRDVLDGTTLADAMAADGSLALDPDQPTLERFAHPAPANAKTFVLQSRPSK